MPTSASARQWENIANKSLSWTCSRLFQKPHSGCIKMHCAFASDFRRHFGRLPSLLLMHNLRQKWDMKRAGQARRPARRSGVSVARDSEDLYRRFNLSPASDRVRQRLIAGVVITHSGKQMTPPREGRGQAESCGELHHPTIMFSPIKQPVLFFLLSSIR